MPAGDRSADGVDARKKRSGEAEVKGECSVDGLPQPGAEIRVTFEDRTGSGSPRGLFPVGGPDTPIRPSYHASVAPDQRSAYHPDTGQGDRGV